MALREIWHMMHGSTSTHAQLKNNALSGSCQNPCGAHLSLDLERRERKVERQPRDEPWVPPNFRDSDPLHGVHHQHEGDEVSHQLRAAVVREFEEFQGISCSRGGGGGR